MTIRQDASCSEPFLRHGPIWFATASLLFPVLTVLGCDVRISDHSQHQVAAGYSSPEAALGAFCDALAENNHEGLLAACDPDLRPAWEQLIILVERERRVRPHGKAKGDILSEMKECFCDRNGLTSDWLSSDLVLVRNEATGEKLAIIRRTSGWYVTFDVDSEDAEYRLRLAAELIKSRLGQRRHSVTEEIGID